MRGGTDRSRRPSSSWTSISPDRPSASPWIGCTLERDSVQTRDRAGSMRNRVISLTAQLPEPSLHVPDAHVSRQVRETLHHHHSRPDQERGREQATKHAQLSFLVAGPSDGPDVE